MENAQKAVEFVKNVVIILFLVLVVLYAREKELEGSDLRLVVVEQKGFLERLRDRVEKLQKDSDSNHQSLLERLRNLEKRHGDSGENAQ